MSVQSFLRIGILVIVSFISGCSRKSKSVNPGRNVPDIIVSTDIGGDDPDDYQSLIHLMWYADRFNILGLVSSPPGKGRVTNIEHVLDAYRADYEKLRRRSTDYPTPIELFRCTWQGAYDPQQGKLPLELSDGAGRMAEVLKNQPDEKPVFILVWGSITDVAQLVHFHPEVKTIVRVYSIGSWNTLQDQAARDYLFESHPDLWWIENNSTFRGMYLGNDTLPDFGNFTFVREHIRGRGALGDLFYRSKPDIKMGDTPSVLYFLTGDPLDPVSESWGGAFVKPDPNRNYWTDNPADSLRLNGRAGAVTVDKWRKHFLNDWRVLLEEVYR